MFSSHSFNGYVPTVYHVTYMYHKIMSHRLYYGCPSCKQPPKMQRLSGCLQGKVVASTINLHSNLQLSVEQRCFEWKARVAVTLSVLKRLCYKDIAVFGLFCASISHNLVYLPIHTQKNAHVEC